MYSLFKSKWKVENIFRGSTCGIMPKVQRFVSESGVATKRARINYSNGLLGVKGSDTRGLNIFNVQNVEMLYEIFCFVQIYESPIVMLSKTLPLEDMNTICT